MFESALIPYTATTKIHATRVLVLAPHPDDEVFGCGGAIAAHVASGIKVEVIIFTDGAEGGSAAIRAEESKAAAIYLGYGQPEFWNFGDRSLTPSKILTDRIVNLIIDRKIDLIYAPSPWEIHPDHRACSQLAVQALESIGSGCNLAFYEIGSPLRPNVILDITSNSAVKEKAINCFSSQLVQQNYAAQISGLNTYRTYSLPSSVKQAEAFLLLAANKLREFEKCQRTGLVSWGVNLVDEPAANLPLVSILIRSTGRQYLYQALNSISLQTWPNIEIIVVSATIEHPDLPQHIGGYPINLVRSDIKLGKSKAANLALQSARGEFLIFLDDDDWMMPDHISRLVQVLNGNSLSHAAYTGIALVDQMGVPLGQTLDLPFDFVRQRGGNLTPIHSVLFKSSLLNEGIQFDETLDIYEDWDFWLQLAQKTTLSHLPGISAVYRVHDSSGVHKTPFVENETAQRIQTAWSNRAPVTQQDLMNRVWSYNDIESQLSDVESQLADSVKTTNELRMQLQLASDNLENILTSKSWRFTKPLRYAASLIRTLKINFHMTTLIRILKYMKKFGLVATIHKIKKNISHKSPLNNFQYQKWLKRNIIDRSSQLSTQRENYDKWKYRPLLSIIMPVYNPPLNFLHEAITSVINQAYSNWELCISDDASTDPEVWNTLLELSAKDARIKIVQRQQNGHISKASNTALSLARGDFIVLMDNDDLISFDALHWVADAIIRNPEVNIIYSDEDKIDSKGDHFGPYLKPDWNYTLFMGHNLISHLGAYRTSLVRAVGGFRDGLEGSQDYDLALRCAEICKPDQIVHIPKVLYHWRAIEGSTALSIDSKPYAVEAAKRALQEHRSRIGKPCHVEILPTFNYVIHRPLIRKQIGISLIQWKSASEPTPTRQSDWHKTSNLFCEAIQCAPSLHALNKAIYSTAGELIILCRDDITPDSFKSVESLLRIALEEETGLVGGTVRDNNGKLVSGGLILNERSFCSVLMDRAPKEDLGYMGRMQLTQELSAVSLNCIAFRKEAFENASGFNSECDNLQVGAVDLCIRLKALGQLIIWEPCSSWSLSNSSDAALDILNIESTPAKKLIAENLDIFINDPAYHCELDATAADFSFKSETTYSVINHPHPMT